MKTAVIGYPRIGSNRELKFATERYLKGQIEQSELLQIAQNLRKDLYYKIQQYSFANIDKFSTSSIVTRLTTDVTNVQNAYMMIIRVAVRAPLMLIFSLIACFMINK